MNKKPNFFIAGVPRSGTTVLSGYLREHPNVFISAPKELCFFAANMEKYREIINSSDLFEKPTNGHLAIGEASVWYMFSKNSIENIHNYCKDVKIIVM